MNPKEKNNIETKMIHTIGDSHTYWSCLSAQHHIGPLTCYRFGLEPSRIQVPETVMPGDTLVFCLGEIDCRCHIYVHGKDTIDGIIDRYFRAIRQVTPENINIGVFNVVPPVRRNTQVENPDFPFRGTDEERLDYIIYFNQKLKEYCETYNFWFIDVYDNYCDVDGFMNPRLSDGTVHIGYFQGLQRVLIDGPWR
jgi:hypothetical protein